VLEESRKRDEETGREIMIMQEKLKYYLEEL
jgi:hypothetical protein